MPAKQFFHTEGTQRYLKVMEKPAGLPLAGSIFATSVRVSTRSPPRGSRGGMDTSRVCQSSTDSPGLMTRQPLSCFPVTRFLPHLQQRSVP